MKKYLLMLIALVLVAVMAAPSFAVELKYGGMFRARLQSSDNVVDGTDDGDGFDNDDDDNQNYIDQRLRMYFTFVSSENLQVVTKWEADTRWGNETGGRHGGGDVGADAVNLEMKNVYVDFAIPTTPVRATVGIQGISAFTGGWIAEDDFSAAVAAAKFDPIKVTLGYIGAQNTDVTDTNENVDDVYLKLDYASGPFKAGLTGFYQYGHGTDVSVDRFTFIGNGTNTGSGGGPYDQDRFDDNHLFDLGLSLEYKDSLWSAYVNFVKNLGTVDDDGSGSDDMDYEGWMVDAGGNLYCGPFTFSLFGFVASGDDKVEDNSVVDFRDLDNQDGFFRYPAGASHYWSEIVGLGTLDLAVGGGGSDDRADDNVGWAGADSPSNLWTVSAGFAWQALEGTKLTLNYYYMATVEDAVTEGVIVRDGTGSRDGQVVVFDTGNEIGHELDMYIDQKIVDKLSLRLVGAYLFTGDAYSVHEDEDDAYELGAQLLWSF
jgi:hypothetical protein